MGSAKATLTEEAFSALTGSDKKIKIESVKQEKKAEKSEQTEAEKAVKTDSCACTGSNFAIRIYYSGRYFV